MSYLGKISALVTVNTGDFAPKLNAAAGSVRSFAKTVQSEIGSSMRQTNAAFQSMYTPLQRFERALQAAAQTKLQFAGFRGAIRSIEELQERMAKGFNARQVSIILKTTGLADIKAFEKAIQGVNSKSIDVIARVGGLEQLKELRKRMVDEAGVRGAELQGKVSVKSEEVKAARAEVAALEAQRRQLGDSVTVAVDDKLVAKLEQSLLRARRQKQIIAEDFKLGGVDVTSVKAAQKEYDALLNKQVALSRTAEDRSQPESVRGGAGREAESLNARIALLGRYVEETKRANAAVKSLEDQVANARSGNITGVLEAKTKELAAAEKSLRDAENRLSKEVGVEIGRAHV